MALQKPQDSLIPSQRVVSPDRLILPESSNYESLGLKDAAEKLKCVICSQIPIYKISACQCTNCNALYCEPCLVKYFSGKINPTDPHKACIACKSLRLPQFYRKELNQELLNIFRKFRVECSNRDCSVTLPLEGDEIIKHEQTCLEEC